MGNNSDNHMDTGIFFIKSAFHHIFSQIQMMGLWHFSALIFDLPVPYIQGIL